MSKRTDYLKEILRNLRIAHLAGEDLDKARIEIVRRIAKRERIEGSSVSNAYRRGLGFAGTGPFFTAADSWMRSGSDTLERTISRSLKSSTDIQEMKNFFASFAAPAASPTAPATRAVATPVNEDLVNGLIRTLKDLHYSITRGGDRSIIAKSITKVDSLTKRAISVRDKRTITITLGDKILAKIWDMDVAGPLFQGEIRTEEELRLVDRLTRGN